MDHYTPLITILVAGFSLAFVLGYIANQLRLSPIVGYLLAGVIMGPSTPGYIADPNITSELAEIGIIFLMFGVGLHFSLDDLKTVKKISIPGAIAQIVIATLLGVGFGLSISWTLTGSIVFGFSLSVASTVVLLRSLETWHLIRTNNGKIAIGWLIIEDIAVVFILVFLQPIADITQSHSTASSYDILVIFITTLLKIAAFMAIMLFPGRRWLPRLLHAVSNTHSNELFRLAVLSIALAVAFIASKLFGVSFALGAFFAGMILNQSTFSQRAAEETLPLRGAFAVLFFVSVGMLLKPEIIITHPFLVLATTLIIILGKSIAAFLIVIMFRYPVYTALVISVSLAQIGEFSFILAEFSQKLGLLSEQAKNLILAGAFISIVINPMLFNIINKFKPSAA